MHKKRLRQMSIFNILPHPGKSMSSLILHYSNGFEVYLEISVQSSQ